MKGKYKVPVFVGISLGLVVLLLVAMVVAIIQAGSQDLPSDGGQDFPSKEIERNPRHPQGEIIALAGPSSLEDCERFQEWVQEHKDDLWFVDNPRLLVGMLVQEFVYSEHLIDDILYREITQDGAVKIGVTHQDIIEEFEELGIPITFEIIEGIIEGSIKLTEWPELSCFKIFSKDGFVPEMSDKAYRKSLKDRMQDRINFIESRHQETSGFDVLPGECIVRLIEVMSGL